MLIVRAQSWNPLVDDERIPFSPHRPNVRMNL